MIGMLHSGMTFVKASLKLRGQLGRRSGSLSDTMVWDSKIAQLNIEHFRKLLTSETDEAKRQTLLRLLAEEEAKLASSTNPPTDRRAC
jgi:hypothetical protein